MGVIAYRIGGVIGGERFDDFTSPVNARGAVYFDAW
jgi:hypothetical protein